LIVLFIDNPEYILKSEPGLSSDFKSRINIYIETLETLKTMLSDSKIDKKQFDFLSVRMQNYILSLNISIDKVIDNLDNQLSIEISNYNLIN